MKNAPVLAALLACCPTMAAAQSYEIVLSRPARAGATHRVVASGYEAEKTTLSAGGEVLQQKGDELTVEITASVTVLETDASGRSIRSRLTIEKSSAKMGEAAAPVLAPGSEVVMYLKGNDTVFAVAGTPVGEDVAKALSVVFSISGSKETDDDIFGTREKKKVGDTWSINPELAAGSLSETGMVVGKEAMKGGATLKDVIKVGQEECLEIEAWLDINMVGVELPGGFVVREGALHAKFGGAFPTNKALARMGERKEMALRMRATGRPDANRPELTVEVERVGKVQRVTTQLSGPNPRN